jgi:hypothetical protein
VYRTFLAGADGLCRNESPVAVATASPNPAEAMGPTGATVSLDGTASTDPDHDELTYTWREGTTTLGPGATLSVLLSLGSHAITLTVDDGRLTASSDVTVVVQDTAPPELTITGVTVGEPGPSGAPVSWVLVANDLVDGPVNGTCTPESGSLFALGIAAVTCSATDAHGNTATASFTVTVADTTPPAVQITSPSRDALPTAAHVDVVVQAADIVGGTAVSVNGVPATRSGATAQTGIWRATVPIALPVAPGGALRFDARATDAAGNGGSATLLVDTDGIPTAMDRGRSEPVDLSGSHSNDFNNGVTAGRLTRNGWTVKLSTAPTSGSVRATASGTGTVARISACIGAAKEVRIDIIGETADIGCNPATGTISVKAVSAVPQIELREQLATGVWQQFNLRTGQSMTVGSPAAASATNTAPIAVQLLRIDDAGIERVVGGYQLAAGASIDVSVTPGASGREDQVRFRVLRGRVPVTMNGVSRALRPGEAATLRVNLMPR